MINKYILSFFLVLFMGFPLIGQEEQEQPYLYLYIDEPPRFGSGDELVRYLYEKVGWVKDYDILGKVVVTFIIEKDGKLNHIEIVKHLMDIADNKVISVLEKMPKWTPGMKDGKPVRTKVYLEYDFKVH